MPSDELVQTLTQLSRVLLAERTLGAILATIARTACDTVTGCTAASVALSVEGRAATAAISGRIALEVDLLQYDTGEGPCLMSLEQAEQVRVGIVEDGDRFPHFARAAADAGVVAVLSVPASSAGTVVGTLNLYNSGAPPFDDRSAVVATLLAAQVAIAIKASPEYDAAERVAEQAQLAVDDHATVSMASGILMSVEECSAEQAEGLLRRAALEDERTVVEVARQVIDQLRSASGRAGT